MAIAAPTNVVPAWGLANQRTATANSRQLVELAASGSTAWDWFGASVAVWAVPLWPAPPLHLFSRRASAGRTFSRRRTRGGARGPH